MEFIKDIQIDLIGKESGLRRAGKFKVKTLLTRKDRFLADEHRRRIIGSYNPGDALLTLQEEAYVLGQLRVRVLEGPKWWTESDFGENLEDGNVIAKLYDEAIRLEKDRQAALESSAQQVHDEMAKEKD